MNIKTRKYLFIVIASLLIQNFGLTADHNDPNAVNSIFSDIPISAADLYGMFGYPSDDTTNGESVIVQLTFAPLPDTGTFDRDMLYKIKLDPDPRSSISFEEHTLKGIIKYAKALKDKYKKLKAAEIKVTFNDDNQARVDFIGFPEGDFSEVVETNKILTIKSPEGHSIKTFLGGRDDPFFNDLPGFFRSINYGPQFYNIPSTAKNNKKELPIPKTLLELEGNTLFNFDKNNPQHGQLLKEEFPNSPLTWDGDKFLQDEDGNYRLVYSGRDAQAGINVNALVFEIPLSFITTSPEEDRIVRTWGESYVLKASKNIKRRSVNPFRQAWRWASSPFSRSQPQEEGFNADINNYRLVDTVGVPFLDAGLSEREDNRNIGANNIKFSRQFVKRVGHLGWGFGPSITAMGLPTCFDHTDKNGDPAPVSVHKKYRWATKAFPRSKNCFFQTLNMPDDTWKKAGIDIAPKKVFEVFVPNLTSIDMDTTGTWPFGRRLEDQVASRFLSVFLDMNADCGTEKCHIETLQDISLYTNVPIEPKNTPNPLENDKEFLEEFPYLAEPW